MRVRVDLQERTLRVPALHAASRRPRPSPSTGGCGALRATPSPGRSLRILNTTTGTCASEPLPDHGFEPLIAGDGVVALALGGPTLRVLAPDPATGRPAWRVEVPSGPGTRPFPFFPPGADARMFVAGDRLYVLRNPLRQPIQVEVLEIDYEALGPREQRGPVSPGTVLRYLTRIPVGYGLGGDAYVTDARATLEGCLLSGASTGDRQARVTLWVGRTGSSQGWPDPVRAEAGGVMQVRRQAAARAADVLVVPVGRRGAARPPAPRRSLVCWVTSSLA